MDATDCEPLALSVTMLPCIATVIGDGRADGRTLAVDPLSGHAPGRSALGRSVAA